MKKLLLVAIIITFYAGVYAQCTDIFFSEYTEGSGNNKAVEIYNPTQNPIDLSTYELKRYSNGSNTPTEIMSLSGMIQPGDVVIVTNGQTDSTYVGTPPNGYWSVPIDPILYALGDLHDAAYPAVCYFNGDDALTLETTSAVIVDIFGKVGEDPGGAWTDDATAGYTDANGGRWFTANHTLVRKPEVEDGVTSNPSLFNVTVEYDSIPINTWDSLGFHTCDCHVSSGIIKVEKTYNVFIFPNPVTGSDFVVKGNDIIHSVEVLDLVGKTVLFKANKVRTGEMIINTGDFNNGLYLVKITFENDKQILKKVVIK